MCVVRRATIRVVREPAVDRRVVQVDAQAGILAVVPVDAAEAPETAGAHPQADAAADPVSRSDGRRGQPVARLVVCTVRRSMRQTRMYQVATRSREELANSVSHGFGLVFAVAAVPVLVVRATMGGGIANVIGSTVFGLALILLYAASTWYHAVPASSAKERLRLLDHAAIYLLIAGTYTPFTLGVLRGTLGWTLLGLVWTAAAVGVIAKLIVGFRYPRMSAAMYLAMGWLAVVAIRPLLLGMPRAGFALLVVGGLSYTVGVAFFAARSVPYAHFVWHLFVLAGSTCHFFAVLWYAA